MANLEHDPEPVVTPAAEPEPEGVVEVQGQRLVPVAAIEAERKRAREATEQRVRAELEPTVKKAEQADQLAADLAALRPQLDYLNQHPELLRAEPTPQIPSVSDEDAERYAKKHQLYTPTGLDIAAAKSIIAENRREMEHVATQAARQAIEPLQQTTDTQASRQNFLWAVTQKAADGSALVEPKALAQLWSTFPAHLTANPDVARVILKAAIGESVMSGTPSIQPPEREPTFTESPGGARPGTYRMSDLERSVAKTAGLTEKQFEARAKTYKPDSVNVLGE